MELEASVSLLRLLLLEPLSVLLLLLLLSGEYEVVVCMDEPTAGSALGLAISAELERQRKMAWQVGEGDLTLVTG